MVDQIIFAFIKNNEVPQELLIFSYRFSFADQELVEFLQEWRFAQNLSAQVSVPRQFIRIPITAWWDEWSLLKYNVLQISNDIQN